MPSDPRTLLCCAPAMLARSRRCSFCSTSRSFRRSQTMSCSSFCSVTATTPEISAMWPWTRTSRLLSSTKHPQPRGDPRSVPAAAPSCVSVARQQSASRAGETRRASVQSLWRIQTTLMQTCWIDSRRIFPLAAYASTAAFRRWTSCAVASAQAARPRLSSRSCSSSWTTRSSQPSIGCSATTTSSTTAISATWSTRSPSWRGTICRSLPPLHP
mmetsp:Transcript_38704/g.70271  ORF Transcript_38704/g.70271 Transcript_38704/m.70271 type:complete len:214 (-) Transcript_38704:638-1279(-)